MVIGQDICSSPLDSHPGLPVQLEGGGLCVRTGDWKGAVVLRREKLALSDCIRAKESALLTVDTQSNSQRRTSLIPSPQSTYHPRSHLSVTCACPQIYAPANCAYARRTVGIAASAALYGIRGYLITGRVSGA
jgi:hypothetical protein